jgi:hypothetical protein
LSSLQGAGEVEDRALRRGDRDPVTRGGLAAQVACTVGAQTPALARARARHGDVHDHRRAGAQVPQRGGNGVAENRPRARSEHGRHPMTVARQDGVADGVDAAMNDVEPAGADAPAHRAVGQPDGAQLPASDHAVLTRRERRDRRVQRG